MLPASSRFKFTNDLEICRILNGMWQVSGAHGYVDPERGVSEMFKYHEAGLTSWDLTDLQHEGRIRHLGLTNFDTRHLETICGRGIPVVSNQVQYSIIDRRPEVRMVPFCQQRGITLLTYGTVLGGLLSEKYLGRPE